jgi:hypothetical protein
VAEIEYRAKSAEGKGPASVLQGPAGGPVMDDGDEDWTATEIDTLKAAIKDGLSVEEAAEVLDRADRVDEVIKSAGILD